MKARYTEYNYYPVVDEGGECRRVDEREETPHFWGVYGRNPDGTEQHIGDALDEESADSFTALLNWLIAPEKGESDDSQSGTTGRCPS